MASISAAQIARVRAFNREYTRRIGVLSEGLLDSPYSLTEARVMYEIAHRRDVTAAELAEDLDLDRGYLSRLLKGFETRKFLARTASAQDGRRQHLRLTPAGMRVLRAAREALPGAGARHVQSVGCGASPGRLAAMDTIEGALGMEGQPQTQLTLRAHRPGDMGWVVQRHGAERRRAVLAAMDTIEGALGMEGEPQPQLTPEPTVRATWVGCAAAWGDLSPGIRLHAEFEALGCADRGRVRTQARSDTRALLDCRIRRTPVGSIFLVAQDAKIAKLGCCWSSPMRAAWGRSNPRCRVRAIRAGSGLPQDRALWTQDNLTAHAGSTATPVS